MTNETFKKLASDPVRSLDFLARQGRKAIFVRPEYLADAHAFLSSSGRFSGQIHAYQYNKGHLLEITGDTIPRYFTFIWNSPGSGGHNQLKINKGHEDVDLREIIHPVIHRLQYVETYPVGCRRYFGKGSYIKVRAELEVLGFEELSPEEFDKREQLTNK